MKKMFALMGALCLLLVAGSAFAQQKVTLDNQTRPSNYDAEKQHQLENYKYDLNDPAEIAKAQAYENKIQKAMKVDGFKDIPGFTYTGVYSVDKPAYQAACAQLKAENWPLYRSIFLQGSN